jgi:hypothetical protein
VTTIGTEYGSFDGDMGANINAVIPLWPGAMIENNRVRPVGVGTKNFEQGGLFYASRLKPITNRTLFHQLINLPAINTQARFSSGTAHTVWDGRQIETSTQTDNGRHKLGFTEGTFKNDALTYNNERSYRLVNYRFANNDQQTSVTEITQGKFWAGDKGFSINQRFWHGDTTLNIYLRRTRMTETQPLVSFAGLQFSIPFTPRENKSLEYFGLKGVSQWTYSLETKILEKDNIITGGYGEVPKVGGTKDVDIAAIRALNPTHVVVNIDENRLEDAVLLREFVPAVIVTHPLGPEDNLPLYALLGGVFDREESAARLSGALLSKLERLRGAPPGPPQRVLYLIWREPWMSVARETYISRMLSLFAWHTEPAMSADRYPSVRLEDYAGRVDRVLLSSEPYPFRERHLAEIAQALPGVPVTLIDGEMTSWYGSRAIAALDYLEVYTRAAAPAALPEACA